MRSNLLRLGLQAKVRRISQRWVTSFIDEYSYHRNKHGEIFKIHIEDCSDNEKDWDGFRKLYVKSFFNEEGFKEWFPDENTRSRYMQDYAEWEFDKIGAQRNGNLCCIKSLTRDEANQSASKIIGGIIFRPAPTETKIDFSELCIPTSELNRVIRRCRWETNVLDSVSKVVNSLGANVVHITHQSVHPDFQGIGFGRKYLQKATKLLIEKENFNSIKNIPIKNPAIGIGLCVEKKIVDFTMSLGLYSIVGHIHYPQSDGTIICQEESPYQNAKFKVVTMWWLLGNQMMMSSLNSYICLEISTSINSTFAGLSNYIWRINK